MDFKVKPIQKLFISWLDHPEEVERIAVTLWKNGRGQTTFIEDREFRRKVLRLLTDLQSSQR